MIQQFRPSLNKQVISYVSKLFPSGITEDIHVRVDGHLFFLTLMMANSRKRLV